MARFLSRFFSNNQSAAFLKVALPVVAATNRYTEELTPLPDGAVRARFDEVRKRVREVGPGALDTELPLVFALVREASRRTLGQTHFDVQLIGGLARRDGAWMGQIYDFLGLSVGIVTSSGSYRYDPAHVEQTEDAARDVEGSFRVFYDYLRPATKREVYSADITYVFNNELGFDYLRDNTAYDSTQLVQRGHAYAIIDEVDSILIDEARTPLIISGPSGDSENLYERFAGIA